MVNCMKKQTSFGFETVSIQEKRRRVRGVFDRVADHYDLMNDLMSFGIHRQWKRVFLKRLNLKAQAHIVDVAGGTADIASALVKTYAYLDLDITVCDLTPAMLYKGRDRMLNSGFTGGLNWVCGQAEALPLADQSVDIYTISFGLRNVGDCETALAEAARVLKPGGQFACLEFSQVQWPWFQRLYDAYSFQVIPRLGEWISQDRASYQYLVESIRRFPDQNHLAKMIKAAGFHHVQWENFLGGISCLHLAQR